MSTVESASLRQRFPEVVVPLTQYNRTHLHAPDPEDPERPLCWELRKNHDITWASKPVDVYPPEWLEWCSDCRRLLAEGDRDE